MKKPKIIAAEWRSGTYTIGIVAIEIEIGGKKWWKAYIGPTRSSMPETTLVVDGRKCMGILQLDPDDMSEVKDAECIAATGARLKLAEAAAFFPLFKVENYRDQGD